MPDSPTIEPVRRRRGSTTVRLAVGMLLVGAVVALAFIQTVGEQEKNGRLFVDDVKEPTAFRVAGDPVFARWVR